MKDEKIDLYCKKVWEWAATQKLYFVLFHSNAIYFFLKVTIIIQVGSLSKRSHLIMAKVTKLCAYIIFPCLILGQHRRLYKQFISRHPDIQVYLFYRGFHRYQNGKFSTNSILLIPALYSRAWTNGKKNFITQNSRRDIKK